MNRPMTENRRLLAEQDLSKSSAHRNHQTPLDDLFAAIAATAREDADAVRHNKEVNKIMLVNKATFTPHHGTIMANFHRKRSKPRRQSGVPMANVTVDTFKMTRPFLPRDDSVFLLKHNTINAIPMIVPLAPADDDVDNENCSRKSTSPLSNKQLREAPLSRIPRRRKARTMSGVAVAGDGRPILVRDDSISLMKKKLAGLVPRTFVEVDIAQQSSAATDDQPKRESTPPTPVVVVEKDIKKPAKTAAEKKAALGRSKSFNVGARLTLRQKQKRFVRQHSLGAPCA